MDSNFSEKPPDEYTLLFDLERCKTAPLICHTPFETAWTMKTGFTAQNIFYETNQLQGFSSEWIHDEGMFRLQSSFVDYNDDSITYMFKYDSFVRFNLNVKHSYRCFGDDSDTFEVEVVFVTKHTPIMTYHIQNPETKRFTSGRYYKQYYQEDANVYWRDLLNARAFKITYQIEESKFYSWLRKLLDRLPCTVTFTQMIHEPYVRSPANASMMEFINSKLPPKAKYNIECIHSLGTVGYFLLDYYLFDQNDIQMLKNLGKQQRCDLVTEYFGLMYKFLKKDVSLASLNFDPNSFPPKTHLGNQYVPIKVAIITPTNIIFEIEEDTANCRGFRKLGHEKILQIKFMDEDLSWFPRDRDLLIDKMYDLLRNGIVVGGKTYHDFGSSSSLFRQHGTYFCEASGQHQIVNVINELAVFKREPVAKVAARLGLFFSSSTEIQMKLRNNEIGRLPDFISYPQYSDEPEYNFSDGIGIIDISFAQQIQAELGLPYMPSAFQFRCLGCKGMVAVDPYNRDLVSNGGQYIVIFRDSQCKFKTTPEMEIDFDVVKYSAPAPLKLHRSFISLMVALARDQGRLQIVERRLHELFTQSVVDILQSLYEPNAFAQALKMLPKHFPFEIFGPEQLVQQEFLRSIVEVNAVNLCKQLNSKCQIPIKESLGRQALGVVDETGLLQPGEIFFQYFNDIRSKSANPSKTVLTGPVGITKSPMYHVGDIRYLWAVDIPELRHHVNVIVFPQYGDRPIPDQIGGGDLDGDSYCAFWDPAFLMEHSRAASFPSPDSSHLQNVSVEELHDHHASFRVNYELQNNLEQISNCFISHITLHHPNHPEVQMLSEKADTAVNSFKSGVFADPISRNEKPIYNPNFCNKRHEPMFDSDHILSQLHKRIIRIYLLMQLTQNDAHKERTRMKADTNVQTSDYAREMYERYCSELTALMDKFNVKTEAELFANVNLEPLGSFNTFKPVNKNEEETFAMIQEHLSTIIGKYRRKILNLFKSDWEADMYQREESLSTYYISNYQIPNEMRILAKEFQALSESDGKFLSFQYLIIEGLNIRNEEAIVDRSVTSINKILDDFINLPYDINSLDQEESIALEEHLIRVSFFPATSTLEENVLHERIISYPAFVISVPHFYSDQFQANFMILKEFSGCRDIAIRLRKDKKYFHHYTIICEGSMKNCIQLETMLTPYIQYDATNQVSFNEMRQRKTRAMQNILEDIFGFIPPPPPPPRQMRHSRTIPGAVRSNEYRNGEPRNYNDGLGNLHHGRHSSC